MRPARLASSESQRPQPTSEYRRPPRRGVRQTRIPGPARVRASASAAPPAAAPWQSETRESDRDPSRGPGGRASHSSRGAGRRFASCDRTSHTATRAPPHPAWARAARGPARTQRPALPGPGPTAWPARVLLPGADGPRPVRIDIARLAPALALTGRDGRRATPCARNLSQGLLGPPEAAATGAHPRSAPRAVAGSPAARGAARGLASRCA